MLQFIFKSWLFILFGMMELCPRLRKINPLLRKIAFPWSFWWLWPAFVVRYITNVVKENEFEFATITLWHLHYWYFHSGYWFRNFHKPNQWLKATHLTWSLHCDHFVYHYLFLQGCSLLHGWGFHPCVFFLLILLFCRKKMF